MNLTVMLYTSTLLLILSLSTVLGLFLLAVFVPATGNGVELVLCANNNPQNTPQTDPNGHKGPNKPNRPGLPVYMSLDPLYFPDRLLLGDMFGPYLRERYEAYEDQESLLETFLATQWDAQNVEAVASVVASILPKLSRVSASLTTFGFSSTPQTLLLAQTEAVTHKPLSFASSPSLPGTISSPWWTDFAHLIYWFYFVATFATVAFLWYLYDFKVRRAETAHPIRETRGFSRAQTGDLITAVLPLTWSATMVMHASTHSINFDENTAGTVFSMTVIAYQWGWNYYFPRDIVTQFERAPRLVGRGRIISFEPTPLDTLAKAHLDSWALRATIGTRHGSRTGRLNASPALPLVLSTDIPAGGVSSLSAVTKATNTNWRRALSSFLADAGQTQYTPTVPSASLPVAKVSDNVGLDTPTSFRAKPSVYIAGSRLTLAYRHFALDICNYPFTELSWVTANLFDNSTDSSALGSRASRALFSVSSNLMLPTLENLVFAPTSVASRIPSLVDLSYVRVPTSLNPQTLLWTGPDALVGAAFNSLSSTEDHGWISPVPAREALLRSALAARSLATSFSFVKSQALLTKTSAAFLLPLDHAARSLLNSPLAIFNGTRTLPFTWTAAVSALEADIDATSHDIWLNALTPDVSMTALNYPLASLSSQFSTQRLRKLNTLSNNLNTGAGYPLSPLPPLGATLRFSHVGSVSGLLNLFNRSSPAWPSILTPLKGELNSLTLLEIGSVRQASGPARFAFSLSSVYTKSPSSLAFNVRVKFNPSSLGFGLDEVRLVRTGSSRLTDSAIISNKLESLGAPSLNLPQTPLALLSLGWSTTASLAAYPSYKLARGGLLRRPFTGISTGVNPLEGLKEPFTTLNLSKTLTPFGYSNLTLLRPSAPQFKISSPSLDTQIGAWASVWAVPTPAPTEDLDPTFINTIWTPEINTTRRSDHNSRYLVSWSPLVSSLTTGVGFNPSLSGPGVRGTQAPALLRSSLLALNELGLKNSIGLNGIQSQSVTNQDLSVESCSPHILSANPSIAFDAPTLTWAALWATKPSPSTNPYVNSATQQGTEALSSRSSTLFSSRALLSKNGALTPLTTVSAGGDKFVYLTDLLAKLDFSRSNDSSFPVKPRQGYIPLSSNISASRRLRVTKGITLPSDTPMHIICGSKDVIHSWAIPGLGVKIDCIPGYNSHRRLLLRWRGAYWGQCMEVCGRYHHWMPIMINVAHPALFIDWCLTFLRGLDAQTQNGPTSLPPLDLVALVSTFIQPSN